MATDKLLPCPFCGGEAQNNDGGNSVYGRLWWAVWCEECQIEMRDREKWQSSEDGRQLLALPAKECFARWNRRPVVTQLGGHESDLHNVLKSVIYHYGPEGAGQVTKDALAART